MLCLWSLSFRNYIFLAKYWQALMHDSNACYLVTYFWCMLDKQADGEDIFPFSLLIIEFSCGSSFSNRHVGEYLFKEWNSFMKSRGFDRKCIAKILPFFDNCIVPLGFLPWEIPVVFAGESQLQQSDAMWVSTFSKSEIVSWKRVAMIESVSLQCCPFLSHWDFSREIFRLLSLGKASCNRVMLPNQRCMLSLLLFP